MSAFESGYQIYRNVFTQQQLDSLEATLRCFHNLWCQANKEHYNTKAVNSAYLTDEKYLDSADREILFNSIANPALLAIVEQYIESPAFLNTQLFFDPVNAEQKNYWHRDIQYGNSDQTQKAFLDSNDLMPHFRIPLVNETGIELVPYSHNKWDSELEYQVRMEKNGKRCSDPLPNTNKISINRGDILVFSAKMLHRGLYGSNRFAFDVLYANAENDYLSTVSASCLPNKTDMEKIYFHPVFKRTRERIE